MFVSTTTTTTTKNGGHLVSTESAVTKIWTGDEPYGVAETETRPLQSLDQANAHPPVCLNNNKCRLQWSRITALMKWEQGGFALLFCFVALLCFLAACPSVCLLSTSPGCRRRTAPHHGDGFQGVVASFASKLIQR